MTETSNCCCGGSDCSPEVQSVEQEVLRRYKNAAQAAEAELCAPVEYEAESLAHIPQEIIAKDYGCGNPSLFVKEGETVLDLGSGSGKICYILAKKVGPKGFVIGVDFNDDMLALARQYQNEIAQKLGYDNVRFLKGRIQDMSLDLDKTQDWLAQHPITHVEQMTAYEAECERLRMEEPMVEDDSVDVVVSNCVLNLVRPQDKHELFHEIHRVLRPGGRAVISDIVCDEEPGEEMMSDPELWSSCISGAFREDHFLEMFEDAGFYGVEILARQSEPWRVIDGIEFRSLTVRAFKSAECVCLDRNQAVIYNGPWAQVMDEEGHIYLRGKRIAVCDKVYDALTDLNGPYRSQLTPVPPLVEVPYNEAKKFPCGNHKKVNLRHPRVTKGQDYHVTTEEAGGCCGDNGCCC